MIIKKGKENKTGMPQAFNRPLDYYTNAFLLENQHKLKNQPKKKDII